MAEVTAGRLRSPAFQRQIRWQDADCAKLFDSVYRGYPIGTLLFWKRKVSEATFSLGRYRVEAEPRDDAWMVIDGQQRLVCLAEALLYPGEPRERVMVYRVDTDEFAWERVPEGRGPWPPGIVPVAEVLDSVRLFDWARRQPDVDGALLNKAAELGKCIRQYKIPAYVLDVEDDAIPREVFGRVNRQGYRLSDAEVFEGKYAKAGEGLGLGEIAATGEPSWGCVSNDVALQSLRAVLGKPLSGTLPDLAPEELETGTQRVDRAMSLTLSFLAEACSIPHVSLLPSSLLVTILCVVFDRTPLLAERQYTLLRRWVWRSLLGHALTGSITELRQWIRRLRDADGDLAWTLLRAAPAAPTPRRTTFLTAFRITTAETNILLCAMASLGPRRLTTGELLPLTEWIREGQPVLPAVTTEKNLLASRFLLPSQKRADLRRDVLQGKEEALRAHGVDALTLAALARGDEETFLRGRAAFLSEHAERFFDSMAEWGADDSPSLRSMLAIESPP